MNIVAQMMVRNEADVIAGTLANLLKFGVKTVCILDGESTDDTQVIITEFAKAHPEMTVRLSVVQDRDGRFHDDQRNILLEMCRPYQPDWIISIDADERYHTSPVEAILAAEAGGANYVRCRVPQFWMTLDDVRRGLVLEGDDLVDVELRRLWYSWGHTGVFIWKWNDHHYYPIDIQKRTPECDPPDVRTYGPVYPICKHYCFRTLEQAIQRTRERRERGGVEYFGKYFEACLLMDESRVGLHRFDGSFDGAWRESDNHNVLYQYFALVRARFEARQSEWAMGRMA